VGKRTRRQCVKRGKGTKERSCSGEKRDNEEKRQGRIGRKGKEGPKEKRVKRKMDKRKGNKMAGWKS
jgi:hypothetical protein